MGGKLAILWSVAAARDLYSLEEFVSQDNPTAASSRSCRSSTPWNAICRTCPILAGPAAFPGTGEFIIPDTPYLVTYRSDKNMEILRFLHHAQSWTAILIRQGITGPQPGGGMATARSWRRGRTSELELEVGRVGFVFRHPGHVLGAELLAGEIAPLDDGALRTPAGALPTVVNSPGNISWISRNALCSRMSS